MVSLRKGSVCGSFVISAELRKDGTEKLYRMLSKIVNQCNGYPIPDEWKAEYIYSIQKEGSMRIPSSYRGISVKSKTSRLYRRFLTSLIEREYMNPGEEKHSRTGRCGIDDIFQPIENRERQQGGMRFVQRLWTDKKPCDIVRVVKLWKVLGSSNINYNVKI